MTTARWDRVQSLFHQAVDLPPDERSAFVTRACGTDTDLAAEVHAMLEEDARGDTVLDRDIGQVARDMLDAPVRQVLSSERFGPYRISSLLGEGGMGVVYLAERADLGSRAAIKILRDAWLSPSRRERFAAEQRTLAQLNHPSIARLYDADTLPDGTPWFVMEYVEGTPLTAYCDAHASTVPERLRLFREVCEAVQHAHRHAIIHRDLKPSNILVTEDGTVKLLDFGIAKQLESVDADHTRTGLRAMTPAYAAPEQVRAGRLGIHTDVYSLGVVLYELLAGQLPFDLADKTPSEVERVIAEEEPERPSSVARRIPALPIGSSRVQSASRAQWADLDVVCLTAMHKDPARRYASVEALVRDVDHFLAAEPLAARPDSLRYRAGKFVRRNWRAVTTAALVFATVVGLTAFYAVRLTSARNTAVAEAARAQRIQRFMMDLFQGNDSEGVGPADSLRVVTLIDQGAQQARTLDLDPGVQAELFETLGTIYRALGKLTPADSLLRAALERRRALYGPADPAVASSLVALGELRLVQAEYDSAEALVRNALAIAKQTTRSPTDPVVARATTALGQVLYERGSYAEAEPVLKEAVRLHSVSDTVSSWLASALTNLANTYFYLGKYDISDSLNLRVLEMDKQLFGPRHALVADILINLGAIRFERARYPEAERYYREALTINEAWYGTNHPETASNLTALGRALVSQQRLPEAGVVLRQALDIAERVYGPVHPRVASALNELARLKQSQGRLDEAEAGYRRMASIYTAVHNDKHYLISIALSNLAGVFQARGEYAKAEETFREAIRRYGQTLEPDHQLVGIAHARLGRAIRLQGRFAEAEKESLAGYTILMKQATPSALWVQWARSDLAIVYDSLGRPEEAKRVRADSAAMR